jgi:hypothetical protein
VGDARLVTLAGPGGDVVRQPALSTVQAEPNGSPSASNHAACIAFKNSRV